ncbi:DUF4132 domain-containing protein [Massilia sp. CCM 8734]|nr:DUF4132 domain-containing protein [Massilia sp. CCM 8734]
MCKMVAAFARQPYRLRQTMKRFEFNDGSSSKFWEIEHDGCDLHVRYGKIGTTGQAQTKTHADAAGAGAAMEKLVREKTGKGYVETGAGTPRATAPAPACAAPAPVPAPASGGAPWLAAGPVLDLPPALLGPALPSRRFPIPRPLDADASWRAFLAIANKRFVIAPDASHPDDRNAAAEAAARLSEGASDGSFASDVVLMALDAYLHQHQQRDQANGQFLDFLVARKGLPYAVEVFLQAEGSSCDHAAGWEAPKWPVMFARDRGREFATSEEHIDSAPELALRAHLAAAAPQAWEQCVASIRAALPRIAPQRLPWYAIMVPELPDIANDLALTLDHAHAPDSLNWLLLAATSPAAIAALRLDSARHGTPRLFRKHAMIATLVQERGADAVAALEAGLEYAIVGEVLTRIGTPASLIVLARDARDDKAKLVRFFGLTRRWPLAAIAALAELLASERGAGATFGFALNKLVRAHAAAVPAIIAAIAPEGASLLAGLHRELSVQADLADCADLPPVLVNPPWLAAARPAHAVLTLKPLALPEREQWEPGSREAWLALDDDFGKQLDAARSDPLALAWLTGFRDSPQREQIAALIGGADTERLIALAREHRSIPTRYMLDGRGIANLPAPLGLALWNALGCDDVSNLGYAVARFGLDALPSVVTLCRDSPDGGQWLGLPFGAVALAQPMARSFATKKAARDEARAWLLAHPEHAACGLIAVAVGKTCPARAHAIVALRMLAHEGQRALLLDVAARYRQPEVAAALADLLDPYQLFPAKQAAFPAFWQPGGWRRPLLAHNGKALPDSAIEQLGCMLRFPGDDGVYAGIADVKRACTAESLADFAWEIFLAWVGAGGPPKEGWGMGALGLIGNDDSARKLTACLRSWPGENQHQRAVAGLDVLAAIGSDTALMLLNGIAQKIKFKALQDRAREKIAQIADARGLGVEELEDRLAPDLGLGEDGTLLLDFGPRQFRVGFDETLKPFVRDDAKLRLADLPKPNKADDKALSAAAVERFKALKKEARTIAAQQVRRLEAAMCAQRRWSADVFRQCLAGHPLVRHLVQRLVWSVYEGEANLLACFRVAADGSFTDAADAPFALPEGDGVRIGIAHALDLPAADAAAFGQLFADYELLQPFAQIGRDVHTASAAELASGSFERWVGVVVASGRVLALENQGWRRGRAWDGGAIWNVNKPLGGGRAAQLDLTPGLMANNPGEFAEQTLGKLIVGATDRHGEVPVAASLATLDAIAISELIRDMVMLCS